MQQHTIRRLALAVAVVLCVVVGYAFANPDGPGGSDPDCATCECLETSYWWQNGDANTQQCKYLYNSDDEVWYITTFALPSGKAAATDPGCKSGNPTGTGTTVRRYIPSSLKRICNGASSGNTENLAAKENNTNSAPEFAIESVKFVCP